MHKFILHFALLTALLAAAQSQPSLVGSNGRMPLGSDAVRLTPSGEHILLYATAECKELADIRVETHEGKKVVVAADGSRVILVPRHVRFRISASRTPDVSDNAAEPLEVPSSDSLNDFLLGLKFRLRVHRGLDVRTFEPTTVEQIGVPAETEHDYRVFVADFNLDKVAIDDRAVLEVLTPSGERITKFFFVFL